MDLEKLYAYALEAAQVSTNYRLTNLKFEKNLYDKNDVFMFDFTSLAAAVNSSRIVERRGKRLLMSLVGDSLLQVTLLISILFRQKTRSRIFMLQT